MPFSNAFLRFLPAQKPQTQGFFLLPSRLIFSLCPALNASFIFSYLPWPLLKLRSWLRLDLRPENQSKTLPFYLLFVLSKNQKPIGLFVKQKKQLVFQCLFRRSWIASQTVPITKIRPTRPYAVHTKSSFIRFLLSPLSGLILCPASVRCCPQSPYPGVPTNTPTPSSCCRWTAWNTRR